jgi:glycosyltransferase involved in cell wall biosynthesis
LRKEITVVICTHNQADYLQKSLESLASQTLPNEQFEIIVIDNASKDHTKSIIQNFKTMENLRYVYEPSVGLSIARNRGWQNAQGDYVAFLDSDALASPVWLERIKGRFVSSKPEPAAVGGRIIPIWEEKRPNWLSKDLETYLGIIDWSDEPFVIRDGSQYYLAGSNIAFRRDVLQKTDGFNVALGRRGQKLLSNEEILLQSQLTQMNMSLFYDPDICVQHHVKRHCLRKNWFYKRLFWQGISDAIVEHHFLVMKGEAWSFFPHLRWDLAHLRTVSIWYVKELLKRSSGRIAAKSRILYWIGRILFSIRTLVDKI